MTLFLFFYSFLFFLETHTGGTSGAAIKRIFSFPASSGSGVGGGGGSGGGGGGGGGGSIENLNGRCGTAVLWLVVSFFFLFFIHLILNKFITT